MCGRFQISKVVDDILIRFRVEVELEWFQKIFNAAPTMYLPVITNKEPNLLQAYRWGLIPFWAKDPGIGSKLINAKAETLSEKPSFRTSLKTKRCLVPANGFYEWKKEGKAKQPYRISLKSEELFAFAGLWDEWKDAEGKPIQSFTIITTTPNEVMADIHTRMPVILKPEHEALWLSDNLPADMALSLLNPYPAEEMKAEPIDQIVNKVSNQAPGLFDHM